MQWTVCCSFKKGSTPRISTTERAEGLSYILSTGFKEGFTLSMHKAKKACPFGGFVLNAVRVKVKVGNEILNLRCKMELSYNVL